MAQDRAARGEGGRGERTMRGRRGAKPSEVRPAAGADRPENNRRTPAQKEVPDTNGSDYRSAPRIVSRRPGTTRTVDTRAAEAEANTTGRPENGKAEEAEEKPKRRRRRPAGTAQDQATTTTATRDAAVTKPAPVPRPRPRRAGDEGDGDLASQFASLGEAIAEIREAIDILGERVDRSARKARLGVFVDVPNVLYGAERGDAPIDMGKLLHYIAEGRELVRATAYSPVSDNPAEPVERQRFVAPFVPHEYRIVTKPLKRFADGSIKGNFDVEMAMDMLTMAERLDVMAVVSGDADFARLVEVIQGRGVRVEVVAFAGSTSAEMRALADRYVELGAIAEKLR